jgi:hypothetical protein
MQQQTKKKTAPQEVMVKASGAPGGAIYLWGGLCSLTLSQTSDFRVFRESAKEKVMVKQNDKCPSACDRADLTHDYLDPFHRVIVSNNCCQSPPVGSLAKP